MKRTALHKTLFCIGVLLFTSYTIAQQLPDKYRVTAYKKGNNQIVSISNEVEIKRPASIYIPNAFTPNGDGLNDSFGPKGEGIIKYSMEIFNRWGAVIFESDNLTIQWNGTYKGEQVPMGAYAYRIVVVGSDKKTVEKTGTVTVVM